MTGSIERFVSLDPVKISDWIFKVSTYDGNVLVCAYSPQFFLSSIRFFEDEEAAKKFVDYLVSQTQTT